ncbi:MAG: nitroreductase/quinone reductase family protein [Acidimicrobiia bacterium]|jgi:deazaflavin-dependent oxidoreductase (nitroreductase family)
MDDLDELAVRLALHADDDYCYLTTQGRVSGRPHAIEIWFAVDGTMLFMLAGARERSDWVRNLMADPAVTVRIGDTVYTATARAVDAGTPEDARARALVFDKYSRTNDDLARWRVEALPVAFAVHDDRTSST